MNTLKTIMVHIDGTAQAAARLALAQNLAQVHRATLTAVFAVTPRFVPLPVPWVDGFPSVPLLDEVDPAHRDHARSIFDRVLGDTAVAARFEDVGEEPPVAGFVRRARLADLVVLGQPDPSDRAGIDVPRGFIASVLMGSGTPAVVAPFAGTAAAEPQCVLVGWKSSREAARALTSALPLLSRARAVHVALAPPSAGGDDRGAIEAYLHAHGVRNLRLHPDCPDHAAGETLLSLADEVHAELLVMGCFGHSRAREWVWGGASRTALDSSTLPLWMAH
jgi:nucleotide-binding universal stress UspA family protein